MAIHEACGIFGIYDPSGNCARAVYYGLFALQHRGQEACGIAANNDRELTLYCDKGMVSEVFSEEILQKLNGTMAIGHVLYAASGEDSRKNMQPLTMRYIKNTLAIATNSSLINSQKLRNEFELTGGIFQTESDAEIMAYAIARARIETKSVEEAICLAMKKLKGAYSAIIMSARKLIAIRDPWGFKPLCIGQRDDGIYIFASESCALDGVGAKYIREVLPGEVVVVEDGKLSSFIHEPAEESNMCIFEYIYFARPDSVIAGQSVHESRKEAGRILARESAVDADMVIGVPDSGIDAAIGYSEESGIPYGMGFIKNRYIGRTFIKQEQPGRETAVKIKLSAVRNAVEGKKIIMIDDSIVRGTTSKKIVNLLREAGAAEIHVRISSPLFISPCYFGTDIPSKEHLIACKYSVDEICEIIGADSLKFLSLEGVDKITPNAQTGFCKGCFTEKYCITPDEV